jgi:hypothetical protein
MRDMTDDAPEVFNLPPPSVFDRSIVTEAQLEAERQATSARVAKAIAERQKEDAAHAERVERERRERAAAEMARHEDAWLTQHLAAGGEPGEWPAVRNELRLRFLAEQAVGPSEIERHAERLRSTGLFNRL